MLVPECLGALPNVLYLRAVGLGFLVAEALLDSFLVCLAPDLTPWAGQAEWMDEWMGGGWMDEWMVGWRGLMDGWVEG